MDVRAADLDGDGDLDIVLANEFQANVILINDGNGNFTNGTIGKLPQPIHDSEDVVVADFDQDGQLDLVFCSEDDVGLGGTNVHEFYLGNGGGGFSAAAFQLPDSEANAVLTADLSGDDLPDLLFGNDGPTSVLINASDGVFTIENDRVAALNRTTQDLALADVDGDGDLDLFEGNENGNVLQINDGNGQFSDETSERLPAGLNIETRKVSFGDIDGDNDLDIFLSNVAFIPGKNRQNRLLINDGTGHFTDGTADQLPVDNDHTIDAIFEDLDLDGDLDLVVANVFGSPIKAYLNNGQGVFENGTQAVFGQNYFRDALGVIAADLNGDGFRDLYICDRFQASSNRKDLLLLCDATSATSEVEDGQHALIYPNPARSYFFIETTLPVTDSIQLLDASGRELLRLTSRQEAENRYQFDLTKTAWPTGLYFIQLNNTTYPIYIERR